MPSNQAVAAAIQAEINPVVSNLVVDNNPVNVQSGIGWPPVKTLQNNVKGSNAIISIYDRKMAKNTTRWNPTVLNTTITGTNLITTVSGSTIAPAAHTTITLSGTIVAGDAVSAVIGNAGVLAQSQPGGSATITNAGAQVVIAAAGSTLSTLAAALAAAVNADDLLSLWVHATVVGAVVTITSLVSPGLITLASYTGSGGTNLQEIGRRERNYQIVVWAPTSDIRSAITNAIETQLQAIETINWLQFPDGTTGRLFNQNDYDLEDATLQDTYRHDFLLSIEYPITQLDQLYSVLAPITQYGIQ